MVTTAEIILRTILRITLRTILRTTPETTTNYNRGTALAVSLFTYGKKTSIMSVVFLVIDYNNRKRTYEEI